MKVTTDETGAITLELSRRNLTILLRKLDSNKEKPESSKCTIGSPYAEGEPQVWVRAVEDEEHYAYRPAGPMLVKGEVV